MALKEKKRKKEKHVLQLINSTEAPNSTTTRREIHVIGWSLIS